MAEFNNNNNNNVEGDQDPWNVDPAPWEDEPVDFDVWEVREFVPLEPRERFQWNPWPQIELERRNPLPFPEIIFDDSENRKAAIYARMADPEKQRFIIPKKLQEHPALGKTFNQYCKYADYRPTPEERQELFRLASHPQTTVFKTTLPNGYHFRRLAGEEYDHRSDYMWSFKYGNHNITVDLTEKEWYRIFYTRRGTTVTRYFCSDEGTYNMLTDGYENVSCDRSVFKKLHKKMSKYQRLHPEPKISPEDDELLDRIIEYNEGLIYARDMDRTKFRYTQDGKIERCTVEGCRGYASCSCEKCVYHCEQGKFCDLPEETWRASQRDRKTTFGRQPKREKLQMREFLKKKRWLGQDAVAADFYAKPERSGPAQSWFVPDQITHNINFDFPFLKDFVKAMESKTTGVPWKRVLKDFAFFLAQIFNSNNKTTTTISVLHFISSLPCTEEIILELTKLAKGWFSSNAQAVGSEQLFVPIFTMLGVVLSTLGVGSLPDTKGMTNFILKLSKIGACIKSVETMKEYITPAMEQVVDYVRVNFFGYTSSNLDAWKSYDDYCSEIQELNNSGFEERLKTEKELVIKIDDLLMRGDVLMKTLDQLRVPPTQRTRFNSAYAWLGRMRNEAAHCSAGKHIPRVPPVIFHFVGKTGVGKSEATSLLNARLLTKLGHTDPSDLYTKVYYRDCGQERFDGYNSGVVGVVVDDFGSRVDTAASPSSEPFEVIRMQNSAVWQLPMASLSEKGSTFFRAKYVIWTSNQSSFKFESITNPEAVLRRVSLKFMQYPRPEFSKIQLIGRENVLTLDHHKVAEAAKTNPDVYDDVWLFDLVDPQCDPTPADVSTGGVTVLEKGLSFDQVATKCENTLMFAQKIGMRKLDHTTEYFRKCVEKQGKAQCWDWFSGKTTDEERTHVDLMDISRPEFRYLGELVGPDTQKTAADYASVGSNHQWRDFYMKKCFWTKKGDKVKIRFVRAYLQAWAMIVQEKSLGKQMTIDEEIDLFERVMFSFNIPSNWFEICDETHLDFWSFVFMMTESIKHYIRKAREAIPESWKPAVNVAFEAAIEGLFIFCAICVASLGFAVLKSIYGYFFGSKSEEMKDKEKLLEKALEEKECYKNPPAELLVLIQNLQLQLGKTPEKMSNSECAETLSKIQKEYGAFAGVEDPEKFFDQFVATESFQQKTLGAIRKNVESHQDKTNGPVRKNVESHQDRTAGSVRKNVESGNAEATNDQNAQEVTQKLKRNIYGIEMLHDGQWVFVGNLVFVIGKLAITNRHIYNLIKDKEIKIFNKSCQKGMRMTEQQMRDAEVSFIDEGIHAMKDVVMIEMPRHCMVHADVRKYFMTKRDFQQHSQLSAACLLGYGSDLDMCLRFTDRCQAIDKVADFELIEQDGNITMVRDWWRYGIHSKSGDCGSVAVAFDPSTTRKIIGIHMAGYDSQGYQGVAVAVHRELLAELEKGLKIQNAESTLDGTFPIEGEETDRSFGNFVSYGKAMARAGSSDTVIKPGPIFGLLQEPKTAPAKLRPFWKDGEIVDPLENARKKADTENVPVDAEILRRSSEHYQRVVMDLKQDDRDDRVLSWEEAIVGSDDHFYQPVKRNTSPGFGWESKGKGKEPWLGSGENYITDHPEVLAKRDEMMERLRNGQRAGTVFIDTLKDERRTIEKVEQGKTRLFAAGEMVYCLIFRQYFSGFNAHIMRNCVHIESTVGINPFGEQWNTLGNRMSEMGRHVVAGDFSNYDGTLSSAVMWEVLDVVERFYENSTPEDRKIRLGLWCDLVNSVHLTTPFDGTRNGQQGFLYQWTHSQPSGNPMTVILNSVYHSIVARYVWVLCARKYAPDKVSLSNFSKYVRHVNYGDDDLYNIHPNVLPFFNQLTMTEAFLEIGMVYTDEAKTGNLVQSRLLTEVAFLKRGFRFDREQKRWRCPHSLDTILEMAMWVKRGANVMELTAEVLEEAHHELAQHDHRTFDRYSQVFEEARAKVTRYWPCNLSTYKEYQEVDQARMNMFAPVDSRNQKEVDAFV